MATGATCKGFSKKFAIPAAYGDLLAALLVIICIAYLLANKLDAQYMVWMFNIVGFIDLVLAIAFARAYEASDYLGAGPFSDALHYRCLIMAKPQEKYS